MAALKPCPFCGSLARDLRLRRIMDNVGSGVAVYCTFCDTTGPVARIPPRRPSPSRAVEMWNDRSGTAAHDGVKPRAACPVCRRRILLVNGRLRSHGFDSLRPHTSRCKGSGREA
jgi:Lar family restriction alleviation protein